MQFKAPTITLLSFLATMMSVGSQFCHAVDPLKVLLLSVHEPELNPDWGIGGTSPVLQYSPERFKSPDNESVLIALEACQRARLRGFVIPEAWTVACRERLAAGESFQRLRGELVQFVLAANQPADAELLWKASQGDSNLRLIVEEQFLLWDSPLALDLWRTRLKENSPAQDGLLTAVKGVAKFGNGDDVATLESLLRNRKQPLAMRYAAADGLARIDSKKASELLEDVVAGKIQGDGNTVDQKAGAGPVWDYWLATSYLIGVKETERTKKLLIDALKQGSNTARTLALRQLSQMSTDEFKKQLDVVRNDPEINVRLEVLRFLAQHVDEPSIVILTDYMGDDQPRVRESARDELLKLADNETYRPWIERELSRALRSDKWWQVEQAVIAVTSLGMKSEELYLAELLNHSQPEVYVTAAWALRVLAHSPDGIAKMVDFVRKETDRIFSRPTLEEPEYHRLGHLIEGLSIRKVPEVRASIERYLPKNPQAGTVSRMSALWGMGKYLEGKPEAKFSELYVTIIYDKFGFGAEIGIMRYCAMIGLGIIADPATKEKIIALEEGEDTPIAMAKQWTLEQFQKREPESKSESK
jgi:HEAT repeat protein